MQPEFFHSTKGTHSVTIPASAQRYHPRSLFQATLPSNINATTLVLSSLGHLTHISYMWILQATLFIDLPLKLTLASDSVSLVVDSMPTSLIASVTFLAISQAQLWTAHHSPSSSSASLPYLRPFSLVLVMLDQAHSTSHLTATFEQAGHAAHASNDRFQLSIEPACMHVAGYPEYLYD